MTNQESYNKLNNIKAKLLREPKAPLKLTNNDLIDIINSLGYVDTLNQDENTVSSNVQAAIDTASISDKAYSDSIVESLRVNSVLPQTGWGDYEDDEYTEGSPFTLTADTDYDLPINCQVKNESQKPSDVTTFYTQSYLEVADASSFAIGETITGTVTGDTAVVTSIDSVNNFLYLESRDGDFENGEAITGDIEGSSTAVGIRVPGKITGRNGDGLNILVDFKAKPTTATATRIDVWINIGGAVGELYRRTISLTKGQNAEHGITMSVAGYTLDTWESNGGIIYVRVNAATDIYEIRTVLTRTHKAQ